MAGRETHFELFLRKNPKASWVLSDAIPDRQKAIEKARQLVKSHPSGGVRVLKEERDGASGGYNSVVVVSVGNCDEPRRQSKRDFGNLATSTCVGPADLFKPEARKTYQQVMPRFLEKNRVLPGELVFRPDLLEQLEAGGSDITQAIQRVAIARSGGGDDLHAIARQLHEMVSLGINKVFKDRKAGQFLTYDKPLLQIVREARKKANPQLAFSSALADRLKRAPNWRDKLTTLLEVWEEVEALEPIDRTFCNDILTHYFSEWIEAPNTLTHMIGKTDNSAQLVDRLISVLEPENESPAGTKAGEPPTTLHTLSRAISRGVLPTARNRIISLIFEELSSNKRLFPGDLQSEFDLLKNFGDRLVNQLAGKRQAEMYEAFCKRSKLLMTIDTVEAYLENFEMSERPRKLLTLSANLVGDEARSRLVSVLRGYISQPQFEVSILGTKNPVMTLSSLRTTQLALLSSKLPDQDRLHGARDIDTLGVRLIGQSQLFRNMVKKAGTPEKAALALFRLAAEALPHGQCARLAAGTATRILQGDDTKSRLAANPDMKLALAQLARTAQTAQDLELAG